jgi:hypothetical protein
LIENEDEIFEFLVVSEDMIDKNKKKIKSINTEIEADDSLEKFKKEVSKNIEDLYKNFINKEYPNAF